MICLKFFQSVVVKTVLQILVACRRPMTNLNYDEDQSRKTAPRSFQFESTLLLFFIYYIYFNNDRNIK
ncbi:hypothetical protein AUC49_12310 [Staphylococcus aureus]|uniref:Uncharacterized protein n=1 Tax=Staphylococcus aureus TaxID=1280 RepID=A0AAP8CPC8_STAAU|nr:hypothetical protein C248_2492 [Staphylococcus aureus 08BA02176]ALS70754.1 hypothetical protein AUC48_12470 [Staphylococcus aureus]OLR32245.1 hypothetical protein WG79_02615 [Staphylococcus aureus subsp. aureus ST398]ALS73366.1 hypothetical protein AUC49_12310 [Staphylococcus aureus]ALS86762.1 hypothetical protein AUC50_13085 [Staphylococcus aureus]